MPERLRAADCDPWHAQFMWGRFRETDAWTVLRNGADVLWDFSLCKRALRPGGLTDSSQFVFSFAACVAARNGGSFNVGDQAAAGSPMPSLSPLSSDPFGSLRTPWLARSG